MLSGCRLNESAIPEEKWADARDHLVSSDMGEDFRHMCGG
jgi:hypothetical protein